jgi:hypothetical protein
MPDRYQIVIPKSDIQIWASPGTHLENRPDACTVEARYGTKQNSKLTQCLTIVSQTGEHGCEGRGRIGPRESESMLCLIYLHVYLDLAWKISRHHETCASIPLKLEEFHAQTPDQKKEES